MESVIRAIDGMSVTQKQEDRWQYWLARASEQRGDASQKHWRARSSKNCQ